MKGLGRAQVAGARSNGYSQVSLGCRVPSFSAGYNLMISSHLLSFGLIFRVRPPDLPALQCHPIIEYLILQARASDVYRIAN